ncbi:MAG: hypothetical protein KAV43_04095 [Hadesarchaea archaeon]|nr:hypothetical protein [Hadesarchaea archaeon]
MNVEDLFAQKSINEERKRKLLQSDLLIVPDEENAVKRQTVEMVKNLRDGGQL